jgi:cation diffusion facilitator CzcD-associated flavoprotein CzcO
MVQRDEPDADVVVVGAGLAGVGMAARLRRGHPELSIIVLEGRDAVGGTWDLFRYPGVRSDSDMATLGYPFRPWRDARAIAPAAVIRDYVRETADAEGVTPLIRFGHRLREAGWSREAQLWRLNVEHEGRMITLRCRFLAVCTGYYRYDNGYTPELPGLDDFEGAVVHPQQWPEGLEVAGKGVVVIGSGATAVTLMPALADRGAHVTMLQRSPGYVAAVPEHDRFAARAARVLPDRAARRLARIRSLAVSGAIYRFARIFPGTMRSVLRRRAQAALPPGFDVDRHFSPRYAPWDERLCAAPEGDLFRVLSGRVGQGGGGDAAGPGDAESAATWPGATGSVATRPGATRPGATGPGGSGDAAGPAATGPSGTGPGGVGVATTGSAEIVTDRIARIEAEGVRLESGRMLEADVVVTATGLVLHPLGGIRITVDGETVDPAARLAYRGLMLDGVPNLVFTIGYVNASWTLRTDLVARWTSRLLTRMRHRGLTSAVPVAPPGEPRDRPMMGLDSGYFARGSHLLPRQGRHGVWRVHQSYFRDLLALRLAPLATALRFAPEASAPRGTDPHTRR